MVIVIVGAIEAQAAFDAVEKALRDWKTSASTERSPIGSVASPSETRRKHVELPEKSQMELLIGTIGPSRLSGDFLAASLGNNILGQFGMMGRIGKEVREKAGLAYYASTSLNSWLESGSWEVSAGINPVNLQKATDLILKELQRFVTEPVSQNELSDSQANFIGRLPLSLESNGGVANAILNLERFNLGMDYYQRYAERVLAVTPERVLEVAQKYIDPEKLVIVSAGTSAEKKA
jgi:zinc protease